MNLNINLFNKMSKLINKHISILKNDIQDLINKIEKNNDDQDLIKLKESKKKELQESILQLNKLLKDEKEERYNKEIEKTTRIVDNLEFQKVKNHPDRNNIILNIKEKRIKAKDSYNLLKQIEQDYLVIDSPKLPAFLFYVLRMPPEISYSHSARSAPISVMNAARSANAFAVSASSDTALVTPC